VSKLEEKGMKGACREIIAGGKPFLGVCVGLQVLFEGSEESPKAEGLAVLRGRVVRFEAGDLKVPHMGWNQLEVEREHPLLDGLDGEAFYFVHSYYPEPADRGDVLGRAAYGVRFCAAAGRENLVAVQFHPEKSSGAGLKLYENFLRWVRSS
jgi:glutamine amidotransferase